MQKNIVFIGPPGCGKGTQATLLKERLSLHHISTGAILRDEVQQKTPIGLTIKASMDSGHFPPENIVLEVLTSYLRDHTHEKGFIFDGFPRTLSQAKWFDQFLSTEGQKIYCVIYFVVNEEILIKRLSGRFTCAICGATYNEHFKKPQHDGMCDVCGSHDFSRRADDDLKHITDRLRIYHDQTEPLLPFYKQKGLLREINVMKPMEEVANEIYGAVES